MTSTDHDDSGTGYRRVDTNILCVLTRFRVRSIWALARFYRAFRRVRAGARDVDGLLTSLFLVEDSRTCYTLSLWRDEKAILEFNTNVGAHVDAANSCFRDVEFGRGGPELWSAQFRLAAVSPHNLCWKGVNLGAVLEKVTRRSHPPPRAVTRETSDVS